MTENNKYVPIAIVVVGLLIAGAIYYRPASTPTNNQAAVSQAEALKQAKALLNDKMAPVSASEHLLGSAQAPLTVIEYSDLECPYCKAFHRASQTLNDKYATSSQLAFVFRHFPLNIHPKATSEAAAAECAATLGGNDKFWQYLDQVFAVTPSNNGLDLTLLPTLATKLGIDETKFNACLNDQKTADFIAGEVKKGEDIGVDGTPFVVIMNSDGEKILPFYEDIPSVWNTSDKQIVEELLNTYSAEIKKL